MTDDEAPSYARGRLHEFRACIDCRHVRRTERGLRCRHPEAMAHDAQYGWLDTSCKTMRDGPNHVVLAKCRDGKLWEPKPPRLSLWQNFMARMGTSNPFRSPA